MILNIFLIVVFLATALALFRDGLWSALVMLLNILLATTVASAWYETVARLLDAQAPAYTYLFDFFSIWGLFALVLLAMREVTDRLSRTKVKFVKQVEMVGAPLVAILAGWIMICFAAAALHTAAVPRSPCSRRPERGCFSVSPPTASGSPGRSGRLRRGLSRGPTMCLIPIPTSSCGMPTGATDWSRKRGSS